MPIVAFQFSFIEVSLMRCIHSGKVVSLAIPIWNQDLLGRGSNLSSVLE